MDRPTRSSIYASPSARSLGSRQSNYSRLSKLTLPRLSLEVSPQTTSTTVVQDRFEPAPPTYEYVERVKSLFDSPRKKSIIPGVSSFPIKYREGCFKRFGEKVALTAKSVFLLARPRASYDQPHVSVQDRITLLGRRVKRRTKRLKGKAARKAKKVSKKWQLNRRYTAFRNKFRGRNSRHGIDWDGFVNFVDRAINETRIKRSKIIPDEPEERKRLRIFKTTEFSITECDARYLGRFN
jgi:hypothetical protein